MKIVELLINYEDLDFEDIGVDVMSIVERPAIGVDFLAFSDETRCEDCFDLDEACWPGYEAIGTKMKDGREVPNCVPIQNQEFSYNDYPESARNNAKRALEWVEENGWGSCGEATGKNRANQLAKGENISEDTIARMASFKRHQQHKDVPYSEGCGGLMWDAWGGTSGIEWASNKLKTIREESQQKMIEYFTAVGETVDYETATFVDTTSSEFNTLGDYLAGIRALDVLGKRGTTSEPETRYRYSGPSSSNSRKFCQAMLRLNKIYTQEEIESFNSLSLNPGFGPRGTQAYSIWDYKGGPNCQHGWEKLSVVKRDGSTVILSEGRVQGLPGQAPETMANRGYRNARFAFSDDDEMIVTGPAMIPQQLILRKDEEGNPFHVFFSKDTIKEIAKKFFEYNKMNNTDINHDDNIVQENTLLESWIVEDPKMDKSTAMGFDVPKGTWMASYKINSKDTWNKIKNGELNGFSIAGSFLEKSIQA